MMEEKIDTPACEQANDLVTYLYGELNEAEAQTFQRHLHACSLCSEGLAAFSGIRRSVVAWRNESLGGASSTVAAHGTVVGVRRQERPSALAAWREFFNLSPLWMKGAVAIATVLFCIFAGLAVARLGNTPRVASHADTPNSRTYSEPQLNALVEERVQDELRRIKSAEASTSRQAVVGDSYNNPGNRRVAKRGTEVAANSSARRPLSKVEREQLAADLRLVASNDESDLELLDDRINQ